jgi:hypothetical protein
MFFAPLSNERKFGFVLTAASALLVFKSFRHGYPLPLLAAFISVTLIVLTVSIVDPIQLAPLYRLWDKLGKFLGKIVSPIVLGVIFFILITPIALIGRTLGRDPLRLKRQNVKSYWVGKDLMISPESFRQQF